MWCARLPVKTISTFLGLQSRFGGKLLNIWLFQKTGLFALKGLPTTYATSRWTELRTVYVTPGTLFAKPIIATTSPTKDEKDKKAV